ncbi:mechanosensitive ion channel domain-containing protein [Mesorhizobium sp. Z1-4]|uniref:mechanosensitive ion channel domain-containing protein n=1 Tax=Mesorhizobium sp. Z1-4 TaxID=2448478 RepID=UPI000FDB5F06|nr:mechanosensitive ion channel domain-containing protein [Mesorhizobium sp. Z1-4]
MDGYLNQLIEFLTDTSARALDYISEPWFIYQVVIALALFALARFLGNRLEPKLESRARAIKGHPGLLRLVAATLRRSDWVIFIVLLFIAIAVLRSVTWPSRSWLLGILLWLAGTWVVVAILSRIIRNRLVARSVAWLVWIYAALVIVGIDERVALLLDNLALPLNEVRISALTVLKAAFLLTLSVWIATTIGNFVDERVQRSSELTPSIRVLIGKFAKFGLVLLAGIVALTAVGVDLTAFTVFSGAVGVGLGFGLQKVVSNFVSGVIILLDKSIKPGDTISLGDTFGWIRELRARFVSVVTRDGREYLIPNEDLITQQVINWSFSDELVRLDVPFGVSYDCDPHKVTELAINAAVSVARVDADRRPVCWITAFGDSSLDFVLRFWIRDPQQGLTNVRGKVLLALWDAFKENGVEIPYPHREIIMKGGAPRGVADGIPKD